MSKPTFDIDKINVKIIEPAKITENFNEVLNFAKELNEYYQTVEYSNDELKIAKEDKANINKFKDKIAEIRKNITKEYNKPIEEFIEIAKETEKTLNDTYSLINAQVTAYQEEKLAEKVKHIQQVFEEYIKFYKLEDYHIPFDMAQFKINNSSSMKSIEDSVIAYISSVAKDIELLNMEYPNEDEQLLKTKILVEYLENGLDYSKAKLNVLSEEKKARELLEKSQQRDEIISKENEVVAKVDEIIAPVEIQEDDEIIEIEFKVKAPKNKIIELREYMRINGIQYE